MDEHPVTRAALEHTMQELADAEREVEYLRREVEQLKREIDWLKQRDDINRRHQQHQQSVHANPWNTTFSSSTQGMSAALAQVDEANLFNDAKLREALGIPDTAKLPQDRKRKTK